ncbi:hypothetical protein [Aeromonas veronii]|uniref:glycosyltransferase family 2 protein n=1 Tax=Aeromonas veronii TaxID=654 RepID=UPI0030061BB2
MYDLCFCVVLYNKELLQSESVLSLVKYGPLLDKKIKVVVFNNGPKPQSIDGLPNFITVHQVLINGSLSKIYNKFIELYSAQKYIFLDDDTYLSEGYLLDVIKTEFNVLMPRIRCQNVEYYPVVTPSGVQTITSGLAISKSAILDFKKNNSYVFDESFDLYGIDTALCYFINKFSYQYTVSQSYLEHQLSHISGNTGEFRKREVLLSNSAALIKYFNIRLLCQTGASVLWAIKKLQFKILYKAFLSFLACRVIR